MKRYAISGLVVFMILNQSVHGSSDSGVLPGKFDISGPALLTGNSAGVFLECNEAEPLQKVYLAGAEGKSMAVFDGRGKEYFRAELSPLVEFRTGCALGMHTVKIYDRKAMIVREISFKVDALTNVDDGGYYSGMFDLFNRGMRLFGKNGVGQTTFKGKTYQHFVYWVLDHFHTMKGMQYFEGIGHEIVDLFREAQRDNGMIMICPTTI